MSRAANIPIFSTFQNAGDKVQPQITLTGRKSGSPDCLKIQPIERDGMIVFYGYKAFTAMTLWYYITHKFLLFMLHILPKRTALEIR